MRPSFELWGSSLPVTSGHTFFTHERELRFHLKLRIPHARVALSQQHLVQAVEPTLRDIREALTSVYGTDYGLRSANYISRFTDMARQAASYRERHVLLAGDAAHVHMCELLEKDQLREQYVDDLWPGHSLRLRQGIADIM
jgi:hypothetical protein